MTDLPTDDQIHFSEVERTLLYIADARRRADQAAAELQKTGAEGYLIEALQEAERELDRINRQLMQNTYFAVPREQLRIGEAPDDLTSS